MGVLSAPFCVSYKDAARSPWDDWVRRGRPTKTLLSYSDHNLDDVLHVLCDAPGSTLYICLDLRYSHLTMVLDVQVKEDERTLVVRDAVCSSCNSWPDIDMMPPGLGGWSHAARCLDADTTDVMGNACKHIFGHGWKWTSEPQHVSHMSYAYIEHGQVLLDLTWDVQGPWGYPIAVYDLENERAAAVIQAAFRGWQARLRYRFSPFTPLGRHLVLRGYKECLEERD